MSRIYFHSPSDTAELAGSERAWLNHLASGPAEAAWDLNSTNSYERACEILSLVPGVPDDGYGANYLHEFLREAQEQERHNKAYYEAWKPGTPRVGQADHGPSHRLVSSLKTALHVKGLDMIVAGVRLNTGNIDLNTALIAGSDQVALAAKIHGWCESHAWIEGPDRAWFADVVEEGLTRGLYRRGMGWEAPRQYDDGPGVVPLLRSRDDEPVVMSYSVCDRFPTSSVGNWMPPWPEGIPEKWDALTEAQQREREQREEEWYDLSEERRWEISMSGLRSGRSWARLSAATLRDVTFHLPVTVYDVVSDDREARVRTAVGDLAEHAEVITE